MSIEKLTYKNSYFAKKEVDPGSENELPSKTISGETYTVKELLQKAATGQVVEPSRVVHIDAELNEIDRLHRKDLDLTDIQKLSEKTAAMKQKIADAEKQLKKREKEKKRQEEIKAEAEKLKKQEEEKTTKKQED